MGVIGGPGVDGNTLECGVEPPVGVAPEDACEGRGIAAGYSTDRSQDSTKNGLRLRLPRMGDLAEGRAPP